MELFFWNVRYVRKYFLWNVRSVWNYSLWNVRYVRNYFLWNVRHVTFGPSSVKFWATPIFISNNTNTSVIAFSILQDQRTTPSKTSSRSCFRSRIQEHMQNSARRLNGFQERDGMGYITAGEMRHMLTAIGMYIFMTLKLHCSPLIHMDHLFMVWLYVCPFVHPSSASVSVRHSVCVTHSHSFIMQSN